MPSILVNGGGDGENSRIWEFRTFVSLEELQKYMRWVQDPSEPNLTTNVFLSTNFVNST